MRRTSNWLIECIICISKLAQCNRSRFFMTNWILMQFFFVSFVHVLTIPRKACIAFETLQLWCQISCIIILKIIFNVRMFGSKSVFFQLRFFSSSQVCVCAYVNRMHKQGHRISAINIIKRAFSNWKLAINGAINIGPCEQHFNCGNRGFVWDLLLINWKINHK